MKTLTEFLQESVQVQETASDDNVYVVYFEDGTMDNYFESKDEADARAKELNNEVESNKCTVKEEPRSNFENV